MFIDFLITTYQLRFTVIFALLTEPLGEVHKAKISFHSKAQANKVIKLFIIWLHIGKAHEIERTSALPSLFVTISSG